MKEVILVVAVLVSAWLGMANLAHEYSLGGYIQGCRDVMNGLYEDAGIKEIDENSLNSYCVSLGQKYVSKK